MLRLHPLTMEDILNTEQRPKVELFDKYIFFVIKMISYDIQTKKLIMEQVSLILCGNTVITFQERAVMSLIRSGTGSKITKG